MSRESKDADVESDGTTTAIRVLHVDDDPDFLDLAATFLEREHPEFDVECRTDATEGLAYLEEGCVDCVVSDYEMPGMDGLSFLDAVRERRPKLPFILFTGKGSEEIASEAIGHGVTDYLHKQPGTDQYAVLANRVANAVSQRRAERRAVEQTRINDVIRSLSQRLVRAESRVEIERAVCEQLTDADPYTFVWFASADLETGAVTPRAAAGEGDGYLDAIDVSVDEDDGSSDGPTGRAIRTGTVQSVQDTAADPDYEPWREQALDRGFRSSAAIPVGYDERSFGVLNVYANRPNAFDETERAVLAELGDTIGHAIAAVETRAALQARETELARYETILQVAGDAVYSLDAQGQITAVNDTLCELVGRDREELVGEHIRCIMDEPDVAEGTRLIRTLLTEGREEGTFEMDVVTADGERIPHENHVALLTEEGSFKGTVGVLRDLSERAEERRTGADRGDAEAPTEADRDGGRGAEAGDGAEFAEEPVPGATALLDGMFEHVPTFISLKDTDCRNVRVSEYKAETLVGQDLREEGGAKIDSREDLIGKTDLEIFGPVRSERTVADDRRVLETGAPVTRIEEANGNHVTKIPWRDDDGEVIGLLAVVINIKPKQRSERLEEFASIVAHDIRNPLAVATGHLSLAPDDEHVATAEGALDDMADLVDELLDLGRYGQVIGETTVVETAPVVAAAWETAGRPGATLENEWATRIVADESRLQRLLENLFRNAIEHGSTNPPSQPPDTADEQASEDGAVTVTVGPIDGEGFYVADDGPGIPPDQRDQVFEWGHSTADGTGYGLAIVERIAEAHGWTVEVEESAAGGARFAFRGVDGA